MDVVFAVAGLGAFVLLAWLLGQRDVRSTRRMDATPQDMRRADDGRPDTPFIDYGNPMG